MWYAVQNDEEKAESLLVSLWRDGTGDLAPMVADPHVIEVMVAVSDHCLPKFLKFAFATTAPNLYRRSTSQFDESNTGVFPTCVNT